MQWLTCLHTPVPELTEENNTDSADASLEEDLKVEAGPASFGQFSVPMVKCGTNDY